ncbi:MAG TPA: endonuclease III [Candidatus Kryptonia bacterium]
MKRRDTPRTIGKSLATIAERLRDHFGLPKRKRDLPDPLELLIATILSQNTNDINSHKAFENLKSAITDFSLLDKTQPRKIETLIKVGGISKKKSRTIVRVVKEVKKGFRSFDHKSLRKIERSDLIERLRALPGVGYKTAACVSLFALGDDDAFPVDTHVHRVLNRIGVVNERTPDKTYLAVRDSIPTGCGYQLHINLIRFGRKICTASKPRCMECPLFDLCKWDQKNSHGRSTRRISSDRNIKFMILETV